MDEVLPQFSSELARTVSLNPREPIFVSEKEAVVMPVFNMSVLRAV